MKYIYKAKTAGGEEKTGEIEADNLTTAAEILRKQNLFIASLVPIKEAKVSLDFLDKIFKKISLRDKVIFTQQLAVMLRSGFALVPALKILEKQTTNKFFSQTISKIAEEVRGGGTLSSSLEKRPDIFPPLYSQVVKSGEKSS